jgi:hypothetical protein
MTTKAERDEAADLLRSWLQPGAKVFTRVLRADQSSYVSVLVLVATGDEIRDASPFAARLLGWTYDRRDRAVRVDEVGTDPGALTVIEMSRRLFSDIRALTHCRL